VHERNSSWRPRNLKAGTATVSVGLGLIIGGLCVPQAVSAAPAVSAVVPARALTPGPSMSSTAVAKAVTVAVEARSAGGSVLAEATKHRGAPYLFGAAGPRRFDCSGFTLYVYRKTTGRKLPHKANLQQRYGKAVSKAKARPGDLVIIRRGSYGIHAGIYAGNGMMWSAPRTGKTVTKQKIWSRNYVVRRLA
jgi:cell wall-associated NlpC family hydrolase